MPRKEYLSTEIPISTLGNTTSIFDDDNYDEDDELEKEHEVLENNAKVLPILSEGSAGNCSLFQFKWQIPFSAENMSIHVTTFSVVQIIALHVKRLLLDSCTELGLNSSIILLRYLHFLIYDFLFCHFCCLG